MDFSEIQGLTLTAYSPLPAAAYLFFRIDDPDGFRHLLRDWWQRVTYYDQRNSERCLNLAFTSTGLKRLGFTREERDTFAVSFDEGIAAKHRSQQLGDRGKQAPEHWIWGGPAHPVDVALLLFAQTEGDLQVWMREIQQLWGASGMCSSATSPVLSHPHPNYSDGRSPHEHFGFADGMSQPILKELIDAKANASWKKFQQSEGAYLKHNIVPAGEFLFGYSNAYGQMPEPPLVNLKDGSRLKQIETPRGPRLDFGRNGTYMVLRQIQQDPFGFWRAMEEATKHEGDNRIDARKRLAAKIVGRWPNGAALAAHPDNEPTQPPNDINAFTYADDDPYGYRCPIGAHIRRTNPRDSLGGTPTNAMKLANRHRLIRRGRPYGPWLQQDPLDGDDGEQRGLMFVCMNVNLERQFEFIQSTWANNEKFDGLYSENDPLVGTSSTRSSAAFTIQAEPVRRCYADIQRYVSVVGASYFFLPSRSALEYLAL